MVPLTPSRARAVADVAFDTFATREPLTVAANLSQRDEAKFRKSLRRAVKRWANVGDNVSWIAVDVNTDAVLAFSLNEILRRSHRPACALPLLRLLNSIMRWRHGIRGLRDTDRVYDALYGAWSQEFTNGDEPLLHLVLSGARVGVDATALLMACDSMAIAKAETLDVHAAYTCATGPVTQFVAERLGMRPMVTMSPRRCAILTTPTRLRFPFTRVPPTTKVVLYAKPLGSPDWDVSSPSSPETRVEAIRLLDAIFWNRAAILRNELAGARVDDLLVIKVKGSVAGVCSLGRLDDEKRRREVRLLGVRREWRFRGAATRLLREAIAKAEDDEYDLFSRVVVPGPFLRAGFVQVPDDAVRLRPGEVLMRWFRRSHHGASSSEQQLEKTIL